MRLPSGYNAIAGRGTERLAALSDGLFGAALCVFSTYWNIAFIILVQLNYVLAPRIGFPRNI